MNTTAISPFGALHTLIALVALVAGILALFRHQGISLRSRSGQVYIAATVFTCLSGFFIFHHGGFGPAHALGILTLVALAVGAVAGSTRWLGRASAYVEATAYSTSFFFHWIPAFTETGTRFPAGAALFSSPEDPALQKLIGAAFLLFLVGLAIQLRHVRKLRRRSTTAGASRFRPLA